MKLLVDMNLPSSWVPYLAAAGIHAEHWSVLGAPDATDVEIVNFAKAGGYVVFTCDLDFSAILTVTFADKPSVVHLRAMAVRPAVVGQIVVDALRRTERELEEGALLTIDPQHSRLRLLPLGLRQ